MNQETYFSDKTDITTIETTCPVYHKSIRFFCPDKFRDDSKYIEALKKELFELRTINLHLINELNHFLTKT